ncbi:uncharacterized protein LOC103313669 [Tribolium castaneum]|uniref:uncharacterized protein LOC103313669 n=1 Tax=Tribolium castaneum TaxID=7070 RepID=UPI0030FE5F0B
MAFQNNFKEFLKVAESDHGKEFRELQEAINRSKETAKEEKFNREFDRQTVDIRNFYKKIEKSDDAVEVSKGNRVTRTLRSSPKKPNLHKGFLQIIHHDPVFSLPIPTNPKFKKYSISLRRKLLSESFTQINKCIAKLAKESLIRAPLPSPIHPSSNYKLPETSNGIPSGGSFDDLVDQIPVENLYVSRSGRQVKRKIYTEQEDVDSDPDFASIVKKNKAEFGDSSTKITLDLPYVPEEDLTEEKTPATCKSTKPKIPRKNLSISAKKPTSRSEAMFDKFIQGEEKRKQQEAEMENFERTLPSLEDNSEDYVIETSPVKDNEQNFLRRRVPPPVPGKKNKRPKKANKQEDPDAITEVVAERASANLPKSAPRTRTPAKVEKPPEEKISCPICNAEFPQSQIENHASTCGIEDDIVENLVPTSEAKALQCNICNKNFPANSEYEVHVRQCIASEVLDM